MPRVCEFYPGICLLTEKKARKNLTQATVYILPKHPHITKHVCVCVCVCVNIYIPGIFPGGKGGRCVGLTTLPPFYVPIVLESGSLNLQEPSGPVQACNGIALPFYARYILICRRE
jgi:hypothetical protein